MSEHGIETTYQAPEVWYKTQRVLRTIFQALVVLVPLVNGAAIALNAYLIEQTDVAIPAGFFVQLNIVIVFSGLLMGGVARLMLVPGVNTFLVKLGLGSVPRALVTKNTDV